METKEHQKISVAEFTSVAIFLAEEAGKIIRQVQESGDLKTKEKLDKSRVTVADFMAQKTIEHNLKHLYPSLIVKGEESSEDLATVELTVRPD